MRLSAIILSSSLMLNGVAGVSGAQADTNPTQTSVSQIPNQSSKKSKKIFSASLSIDTSTTLEPGAHDSAGEGYSQSGTYRLDLGASLSDALKGLLRTGYSQEYSYVRDDGSAGGLIDTLLSLTYALGEARRGLSLSLVLNSLLPTSKDSRKVGLQFAAGPGFLIDYKTGHLELGSLTEYYEQFHDVEVSLDGKSNIQRSIRETLTIGYDIDGHLGLSALFRSKQGWTYQGATRTSYVFGYELGYSFNSNVAMSVGLMTDQSALKDNGLESNYTLFDANQTAGYFDIVFNI